MQVLSEVQILPAISITIYGGKLRFMLCGENVTVKQLVYLLISCGFRKCELWTQKAYINANCKTKTLRSHRIASKKIDLLHEAGLAYKDAQKFVICYNGRETES